MGLDLKAGPELAQPVRRRSRTLGVLLWVVLIPLVGWAALWTTGWDAGFRWVQLVAFTPYVAAVSVPVAAAALLLRRRAAAVVAVVVMLVFAAGVLPRALPEGGPEVTGPPLRVLSSNLQIGEADAASLVALVRAERPDVVTLQEVTPLAAERLASAGLDALLPHRFMARIRPGSSGSAIYSRLPVEPLGEKRPGQMHVLLTVSGVRVDLASVHPCAPSHRYKYPCWGEMLRGLPAPGELPTILAGDFNSTLDHGVLRDLLATGYRDAADATGRGLASTWPMRGWGPLPGVTIDHLLADGRIAITAFRTHLLPGTDHRATVTELRLPAKGDPAG